jgi:poly-gamma-glutamate synthesis protein (capsule biosynthesis protein)
VSGITFLGDVMLGRDVATRTSPEDLQQAVQELIGDHALVANLECCITEATTPGAHAHSAFAGSRPLLTALRNAGLTASCVANNHSLDFGSEGFKDTVDALQALGVQPLGLKDSGVTSFGFELEDRRLRVFSACALTLPSVFWKAGVLEPDDRDLRSCIENSIEAGEEVILYIHWGHEGISVPPPEARTLARTFAELGVRLIIGHGPHVVQGIEQLGNCTVYYSLGDAIFDRADVADRSWSLKVDLEIDAGELQVRHEPFTIDPENFTPRRTSDSRYTSLVQDRSEVLSDPQAYDRLFAKEAGEGFLGKQIRSTVRLMKRSGVRGLLSKVAGLRLRHLRLLSLSLQQLLKRG